MAGITATYSDADTFTVSTDLTSVFMAGRRVKANCGVDGYKYGTITSSSYGAPNTTVNLTAASDDLTSNLTEVWVGVIGKGTTQAMPAHTHDGAEGTGDYLPSLRLASSSGGLWEDNQAAPSGTRPAGYNGYFYATRVYNAVWNDIADFQPVKGEIIYGRCYYSTGQGMALCNKKAQKGVVGIASNTYGIGVGSRERCVPIAIGGWVLACVDRTYEPGTPLINDKRGFLTEAKWYHRLFFSERIIAYYDRKELLHVIKHGEEKVEVNGRHWVRVI
jgi:hypothetical protein